MRNRRGLSTVVGAVFFVIAATTVISYISYSMNTIDQFAESVIVKEAENINRGLEHITISKISIDGGEFNMTVVNTGSLPVHLTRLWITDEDSAIPDQKLDLDVRINPGNEAIKIGQGTGIVADSAISYTLKAITERGNIATFSVSPDLPIQMQLVAPAEVQPNENFRVTAYFTNNSTKPNNIANLIPILNRNMSLTEIDGPVPTSIQTLPQGNTAIFSWTFQAPEEAKGIGFDITYTGAPSAPALWSNTTVALPEESETTGTAQWSQAASRVGILISGIPNPINSGNPVQYGKWGIGIINPLDRDVEIYSVGIGISLSGLVESIVGVEPTSNWRIADLGSTDMVIWEGGSTPVIIYAKSVGQFRVEMDYKLQSVTSETIMIIQALTSEGKLSTLYTVSSSDAHPMINAYYTSDPTDPTNNWTYLIEGIPSTKQDQLFNATVHNSASASLTSKIQLLILVPSDFTDVTDVSNGSDGWDVATIVENPDGSHIIKVTTTSSVLLGGTYKTYQFSADPPFVIEDKLYVFQTTTVYPTFNTGDEIQLASALSEAGVEVVP